VTVTSGGQPYPDDATLHSKIALVTDKAVFIDGEGIASGLGNIRAANVVLLGALSALMQREGLAGTELSAQMWLEVITARVPAKYVDLNRKAFEAGRENVK